jgi:repressor LexA
MEILSPKEELVYKYIVDTIADYGYSPSVRDICSSLSIKSTSTAYSYIEKLISKGYLRKDTRISRSYRPVSMDSTYKVPIIGKVTAGIPITAIENHEGYYTFSPDGLTYDSDKLFALRVSGTSMIEAGIMDGDLVIVEKTPSAENGQIIVAMVDDSATVKTFYKENGKFRLQPENSTMAPIICDEVSVIGRVVASVRYY